MIREAELGTKFTDANIIRYVTSWIDTVVEERKPIITEVSSEASIRQIDRQFLESEQKSVHLDSDIYEWNGSSDSMSESESSTESTSDNDQLSRES